MARLGIEQLAEVSEGTYGLDALVEIEAPESVNGAAATCEYSIDIVSTLSFIDSIAYSVTKINHRTDNHIQKKWQLMKQSTLPTDLPVLAFQPLGKLAFMATKKAKLGYCSS